MVPVRDDRGGLEEHLPEQVVTCSLKFDNHYDGSFAQQADFHSLCTKPFLTFCRPVRFLSAFDLIVHQEALVLKP